jgi:hypothetical protein
MGGRLPAWLRSRWLLAIVVVAAAVIWALWQPDIPPAPSLWDPKP